MDHNAAPRWVQPTRPRNWAEWTQFMAWHAGNTLILGGDSASVEVWNADTQAWEPLPEATPEEIAALLDPTAPTAPVPPTPGH